MDSYTCISWTFAGMLLPFCTASFGFRETDNQWITNCLRASRPLFSYPRLLYLSLLLMRALGCCRREEPAANRLVHRNASAVLDDQKMVEDSR